MQFQHWLQIDEAEQQQLFPFMTTDDPPNLKKIARYPDMNKYVAAMSRGGRKTEDAAKQLISMPVGGTFLRDEEIVELVPSAVVIPPHTFPGGHVRPLRYLAIAYVKSTRPINPDVPDYNRPGYRILAYYQGAKETFTKDEVLDWSTRPVGGLMGLGGYITHVWVDKEFQGDKSNVNMPNLYKELLNFARQRGIVGLAPEKTSCGKCGTPMTLQYEPQKCPNCGTLEQPLTSKSFRAAQAKYDWKRAQPMLGNSQDQTSHNQW